MGSIRQSGGLSGFTKRTESDHDAFGAGHSSTSISAGLGMAVGRDFKGRRNNVVAVIGDGAITGGMAYEAMNHAGFLDSNMIVILNDNQQVCCGVLPCVKVMNTRLCAWPAAPPLPLMSLQHALHSFSSRLQPLSQVSLPTQYNGLNQLPVGALSSALSRLQANKWLREGREVAKWVTKQLPQPVGEVTAKVDEYARGMISGQRSTLFEELGLYYIGPVDGHNLDDLVTVLNEVKKTEAVGPVLIHVCTEKGRGYEAAETAQDKVGPEHFAARLSLRLHRRGRREGGRARGQTACWWARRCTGWSSSTH